MHSNMLTVDGQKMSKSSGNYVTLFDVFEKFDPLMVRYFIAASHYRSVVDFSESALTATGSSLKRLHQTVRNLRKCKTAGKKASGKYFEELEVGAVFEHQPHRTITETDNLLFSTMTHNPQPLHIDAEFAKQSQNVLIQVNSLSILCLVVGTSVSVTTMGTIIGYLGMQSTETPNPVVTGDMTRVTTRYVDKLEPSTEPDRGIDRL